MKMQRLETAGKAGKFGVEGAATYDKRMQRTNKIESSRVGL